MWRPRPLVSGLSARFACCSGGASVRSQPVKFGRSFAVRHIGAQGEMKPEGGGLSPRLRLVVVVGVVAAGETQRLQRADRVAQPDTLRAADAGRAGQPDQFLARLARELGLE